MANRRGYSSDPHWITLRHPAECSKCKAKLRPGLRTFYYPATRTMLCSGDDCGLQASRDLDAAKQDEDFMSSQFGGY